MKYLIFFFLFLPIQMKGTEVLSDWKTAYNTENVELQYRWLLVGDSLKIREMRAIFSVDCSSGNLIHHIRTPKLVEEWALRTKVFRILEEGDDEWISYTLFDIPKPFRQQDQVTLYRLTEKDRSVLIELSPCPAKIAVEENTDRMKYYSGRWELSPVNPNKTNVAFYSVSYTRPSLPRFIQDPILQRMICNSFEELIQLSAS